MKIAAGFNPEQFLREQELSRKRTFWPRFFAKSAAALGWCAWFFASFFAAQYAVAFAVLGFSRVFGFDAKNLTDFANALIEIALYAVLAALFIFVPTKLLPIFRRYFSRFFAKTHKNPDNFFAKSAPDQPQQSTTTFAKSIGLARIPRPADLGFALYFFPVFYFTLIAANLVATYIFGLTAMSQAQNISFATSGNGTFQLVIIFTSLVVVAPIVEEILLRGWLFTKLREKLSFWPTAIFVSLVFALAHGQLNVGIMTFILSMCNSRIREKSGVIYGAIMLHAAVNFIAFAIKYLGFLHGAGIGV
jgi:membrane protease YdiL (CAAX protease family)